MVDTSGEPINYATVTAHLPDSTTILAYSLADAQGRFKMSVAQLPVHIQVRFLGKAPDTLLVTAGGGGLNITLRDQENQLPSVTVGGQRPPITTKGDTTTFDVKDFRDSTDHRIEEVLRRLPGVEIKDDGSIKVNGKNLHRILIEGSDLFGADYQTASKNFRATDIGTIEAIDHYEQNPVLKSVNNSEAIILNLKLEEGLKSVLRGDMLAGTGYGDEFKYHLQGTLFRIGQRHKSMITGNSDNVASGLNGLGTHGAARSSAGYDLRRPANDDFAYFSSPSVDNVGLPNEFTDNGHAYAGQLNHESRIGKGWTLNATLDHGRLSDGQTIRSKTSFISDTSRYTLQNLRTWKATLNETLPELEISYLSPDQRSSFNLYLGSIQLRDTSFNSYRESSTENTWNQNEKESNTTVRALYSREIQDGFAGQLELTYGKTQEKNDAVIVAPALSQLLTGNPASELAQNIQLKKESFRFQGKLLYRWNRALFEWRNQFGQYKIDGSQQPVSPQRVNTFLVQSRGAEYLAWQSAMSINYDLGERAVLQASAHLGRTIFFNDRSAPNIYGGQLSFKKDGRRGKIFRASLYRNRTLLSDERLLYELPFADSPFSLQTPGSPLEASDRTGLRVFYQHSDNVRLRNFQFNFALNKSENGDFYATQFNGQLVQSRLAYGQSEQSASTSARYTHFSTLLKSDIIFYASTSLRSTDYFIEEAITELAFWTTNFRFETSYKISPDLRIKARSGLRVQQLLADNLRFGSWRNELTFLLAITGGQAFAGMAHFSTYQPNNANNLWSTFIGGERKIKMGKQPVIIRLKAYNLLNTGVFRTNSTNAFYTFQREVEAVGRFFLLSAEYSL